MLLGNVTMYFLKKKTKQYAVVYQLKFDLCGADHVLKSAKENWTV